MASRARKFHIRNWDEYQAYKHRNPPWVRLYFDTLNSRDWIMLDGDGRALMIALILLASRDGGYVVNDFDYIARATHFSVPVVGQKVPELVQLGFLECDKRLKSKVKDARICTHLDTNVRADTESDTESEKIQKEDSTGAIAPKSKKRLRSSMPENWPTEIDRAWAIRLWKEKGREDLCTDAETQMAECRDHHDAAGTMSANWAATWRTWAGRAIRYNRKAGSHGTGHSGKRSTTDQHLAGIASLIADCRRQ